MIGTDEWRGRVFRDSSRSEARRSAEATNDRKRKKWNKYSVKEVTFVFKDGQTCAAASVFRLQHQPARKFKADGFTTLCCDLHSTLVHHLNQGSCLHILWHTQTVGTEIPGYLSEELGSLIWECHPVSLQCKHFLSGLFHYRFYRFLLLAPDNATSLTKAAQGCRSEESTCSAN